MSQQPVITTVIPTYRRPKLLRRAIQSVLNQSYPHFQVCVYDNASGDETEAVVAEIMRRDSRVRYHRHAQNIGLAHNFAYGAAQVTTPFLNFLSDDDLLLPKFFATAMSAFERHPSAAVFVGKIFTVTRGGTVMASRTTPWESEFYDTPNGFFQWLRAPFNWSGAILRQTAVREVGGLDPWLGESFDQDLILRIVSRFPISTGRDPCAIFSAGGASSKLQSIRRVLEESLRTTAKIAVEPSPDLAAREKMVSALEQFLANRSFSSGLSQAARFGRLDDARAAAETLRRFFPCSAKARVAELFGSNSLPGKMARTTFRVALSVRSPMLKLVRYRSSQRFQLIVQNALAGTSDSGRTVSCR